MSWTRKKGDFLEHYFTNNDNLKSELREIKYCFEDHSFSYLSDNGVFSKNRIDYGSKLLLETIIRSTNKHNLNILDVGCGYGFIGIALAKILDSHADMVDVNKRAIHLAEINIKNNKVDSYAFLSNAYESVTEKFDLIVSNPPYIKSEEINNLPEDVKNEPHIALDGGKDGLEFYKIIKVEAKKHLNENGYLCLEIGYDQAELVKDLLKDSYKEIEIIKDFANNDRCIICKYY